MGVKENKDLIKRLFEVGFEDPSRLDEFYADQVMDHSMFGDLGAMKKALEAFHDTFPRSKRIIKDMLAEGDKVAVRAKLKIISGTGIRRELESHYIYLIKDGKIVEQWGRGDLL